MDVNLRNIKRGEILNVILDGSKGSEQGGERPVVVIQNNIGNTYSPTIIVACITSQLSKAKLPTHVELDKDRYGLKSTSIVLCEQIRTLDKKSRIKDRITMLDEFTMKQIDKALEVSLDLKSTKMDLNSKSTEIKSNSVLGILNKDERKMAEYLLERLCMYNSILQDNINESHRRYTINEKDSVEFKLKKICRNNNIDFNELYKNVKINIALSI